MPIAKKKKKSKDSAKRKAGSRRKGAARSGRKSMAGSSRNSMAGSSKSSLIGSSKSSLTGSSTRDTKDWLPASQNRRETVNLNPGVTELADQIRAKLIRNAEMERLNDYLDNRLAESGWKMDIRNILRIEVQKGRKLTLEKLYSLVKERGKMLVPRSIESEMVYKIKQSLSVLIPESEVSEDSSADNSHLYPA